MKSATFSPASKGLSWYQGETIRCNFSSGWTDYKAGESPAELLKRADDALYSNKRSGKQKVDPSGVPSAVPQAAS